MEILYLQDVLHSYDEEPWFLDKHADLTRNQGGSVDGNVCLSVHLPMKLVQNLVLHNSAYWMDWNLRQTIVFPSDSINSVLFI